VGQKCPRDRQGGGGLDSETFLTTDGPMRGGSQNEIGPRIDPSRWKRGWGEGRCRGSFDNIVRDIEWQDRPIALSLGRGKSWHNVGGTVRELMDPANGRCAIFSRFDEIPLKGDALGFTQGPQLDFARVRDDGSFLIPRSGHRRNNSTGVFYSLFNKDYDCGVSAEAIDAALGRLGLGYIRYPTFSHGATSLIISADDLAKFDSDPNKAVVLWMEWRGTPTTLAQSVGPAQPQFIDGQDRYVFTCAPWPKWRVILILAEWFWLMEPGLSIAELRVWMAEHSEEYARRSALATGYYVGFDAFSGLPGDPVTKDKARLMYVPCHSPGRTDGFEITMRAGKPLDLARYAPAPVEVRANSPRLPKVKVSPRGETIADDGSEYKYRTRNLFQFAGASRGFDPVAFLRHYGAERFKVKPGLEGIATCRCPLAHEHSGGGDVAHDAAFWARAASDGASWFMKCHHGSGRNHGPRADRLKFLDSLCVEFGIGDAMRLVRFCSGEENES
jgi:hypothetical protein